MDFIFLWLVTFVLGFWMIKKINQWKVLPPSPWGLPIVGYLPFIDRNQPHLTLTKLAKRYGPIYSLWMGSIYTVVLSDHKLIREAFAKDVFSGRAPLYLTHGIMKGNGIICAEGSLWKDQRKLVTTWLKNFGMSKHSVSRDNLERRIAAGVSELIEHVKDHSGEPLDLSTLITHSLGNVVNDIIFGFKYPRNDKTWIWLRQIQEEGCHEMGVAGVVNFLPFLRFLSSSTRETMHVIERGQEQTHKVYASIVLKRRKMLRLNKPKEAEYAKHADIFKDHPKGFVKCVKYSKHSPNTEVHYFDPDVLITSDDECILDKFLLEQKRRFENGDESASFTSDEQLMYLLADMFGAGLDTSSVTLNWFLLQMALHPDEQDRVHKEIITVYPENNETTKNSKEVDYSKLPYLMAAISECQRIRSIVPVGIPHGCLQDTYLGNYLIPKGSMVMPLQWAIHMDPNVWEDPEMFKPSRFLDDKGNLMKPQEFIPFQTGKRMCPGDELARMLTAGLAVQLFRSVRVQLASKPPTKQEMEGHVGVVLSPPNVLFFCEPRK